MRGWWLRTDDDLRHVAPRSALGLAALVACSAFGACGGHSTSKSTPAAGGSRAAAAGGGGAAESGSSGVTGGGAVGGTSGEVAGASGSASGAAGATNASGGQSGGHAAVGNGGTSGAGAAAAGAAGDSAASAGESSGGAGGGCQDLCSDSAPACCTDELRCVERVPSCRIDVLAADVGVIYEYDELQAKIDMLSDAVELTIPLAAVERASADPPAAARFELTLAAENSTELSELDALSSHAFRLTCDEQEVLVGVVYFEEGAAAIRTPVLHAAQAEDGALVLRLGAWQGAWLFHGEGGTPELRQRLDRTELRAELCGRGILQELEL